jgi:hypothetical protein
MTTIGQLNSLAPGSPPENSNRPASSLHELDLYTIPRTEPQFVASAPKAGNVRTLDTSASGVSGAGLHSLLVSKPVQDVVLESQSSGLYRKPIPNNQDGQNNSLPGLGGKFLDAMPPYVFSPRRQTDQMVRQAYALLPEKLKDNVAFIHAQRLAQDPEGAARLMYGKKEVVIVGSFKGINSASSLDPKVARIHDNEMKALELSLKMARAMGIKVRDVVYGMGDSSPIKVGNQFVPNSFATSQKEVLENRMNTLLSRNGYRPREELSWGADELMVCAFAAQLPKTTLSVNIQDPSSRFFMIATRLLKI